MKIPISDIHIGERRREALGDIEGLARSIEQYGLLHPPVIDKEHTLIAGLRRVRAHERLGRTEIEVRVFDDLTEAERREIELEENIRRKDLTAYERSKHLVQLADSVATRLKDEAETSTEFSLAFDEKSSRGRPPKADAEANVAAEIGVSQPALSVARQHVAAVERYPELQDVTQREALTTSQELDLLPEETREQRRDSIQNEVAQRGHEPGHTRRRASRSSSPRRTPDPNGKWLKAMQLLWRFGELTRQQAVILGGARRWSPEARQRYGEVLQQTQTRLSELKQAIVELPASAEMATASEAPHDQEAADGQASKENHIEHESTASEDPHAVAVEDGQSGDPTAPEEQIHATNGDEPPVHLDVGEAQAIPGHGGADHDGDAQEGDMPMLEPGAQESTVPDLQVDDGCQDDHTTQHAFDETPALSPMDALGQETPSPSHSGPSGGAGIDYPPDQMAALMTRITALRSEGCSWRGITRQLNAEGVPPLSGSGQ